MRIHFSSLIVMKWCCADSAARWLRGISMILLELPSWWQNGCWSSRHCVHILSRKQRERDDANHILLLFWIKWSLPVNLEQLSAPILLTRTEKYSFPKLQERIWKETFSFSRQYSGRSKREVGKECQIMSTTAVYNKYSSIVLGGY